MPDPNPNPDPSNEAPGKGNAPGGEKPDGDGEGKKYLTEEQFNKAWTKREARMEKRFSEQLLEANKGRLTKDEVAEMLKGLKPEPKPPKGGDQDNERITALENELKKVRDTSKEERGLRKRLEQEARDKEALGSLRSILQGAGISKSKAGVLAKELLGRQIVKHTDNGLTFDYDDETHSLDEGVKAWLGGDEGKEWAPAAPAGGSGARPSSFGGLSTERSDDMPSEADVAEALIPYLG